MSALLELNAISLKLQSMDHPILSDIHYRVLPHDFIIVLGSNGSGKSSLLKLMDQRYTASSGKIFLHGKSIEKFSNQDFSKKIITLTQNCHDSLFVSLTVLDNYLLVKQRHESKIFSIRQRKEREFFANYLQEFNPNLSLKLDQVVEKLSGGEKQALALALSVLYPPEILLLDEHTSALDPKSAQQLMALTHRVVTDHKITCILTTHDLDIAMQYGNRILALKHGKIFKCYDHSEKNALSQTELLAGCY